MNSQDIEQQEKLQAAAERGEREHLPAGDPQVDAYRLIWRALKQPLAVTLPADFAQQVMRRLQVREEAANLERWLTNTLMATMALVGTALALPPLAAALAQFLRATAAQPVPWLLIFTAAASLALAWVVDTTVLAKQR